MAAKRIKSHNVTQWTRRLAGLVVCSFFALGVATGMNLPAHQTALGAASVLKAYVHRLRDVLGPALHLTSPTPHIEGPDPASHPGAAIALVERPDGFYSLLSHGALRGPLSSSSEGNLPILSGEPIAKASPKRLLTYAAMLVRSEAELSEMISELHVNADGSAALFFEHARTELLIDPDAAAVELRRARRVLRLWRGHESRIASLDMTVPGQAIMHLRRAGSARAGRVANTAFARNRGNRGSARAKRHEEDLRRLVAR